MQVIYYVGKKKKSNMPPQLQLFKNYLLLIHASLPGS